MPKQTFKEKLDSGQFLLGTWSQSASPENLEIIGYAGFDYTIIDTEHGYFGLETAENLVRAAEAANISPLVRVELNAANLVLKALDIGAEGVVVPQITNEQEAAQAISYARYYPDGSRGACPCIRAGKHYVQDWSHYATKANREAIIVLLIEGREGIANIEPILNTPGVNAIMIGPFDLSVSLGVGGQLDHPLVIDFMRDTIALCKSRNIHIFVPNFDLDLEQARAAIDAWADLGATLFTVGTDKLFFAHHMQHIKQSIRGD
ncbi:HpcH/HpaI aldolase family protein [Alcaligenes endophyticus]|uniref:Aldolase/citrate lyase family protein n=1 Tax=Alcaligenes endophyticus TaxID=1929088 RepID=A0ABT8EJS8_9BURK|nr:aldolase/citrate lyase family protein [Alcaligenes endophyticus]MCX5591844.1 aldolase/citrate lyase family protein [Alcaligenes endophyticus]MDN4121522.1 aldolase/citrate lyase family protein [Alcaligenes endophyticus]